MDSNTDRTEPRQGLPDRPTLTRRQVAERLGRDISWVRRREGKSLNPRLESGVYFFELAEVVDLESQLGAELGQGEASVAQHNSLHFTFEQSMIQGQERSVDAIAVQYGLTSSGVRQIHKKWTASRREQGKATPPLLTQRVLSAKLRSEELAMHREYDQRMATYTKEADSWLAGNERRTRKMAAWWASADRERNEARARRNASHEKWMADVRKRRDQPGLLDRIFMLAKAVSSE